MHKNRSFYIIAAVVILGLIYVFRLLQIQVLNDDYAIIAEKISLRRQTEYPQRGLIFDRNKNLIVYNDPVYYLMLSVPINIKGIDTAAFCSLLEIDRKEFDNRLAKSKRSSYRGKSVFKKNIPKLHRQVVLFNRPAIAHEFLNEIVEAARVEIHNGDVVAGADKRVMDVEITMDGP